MRRSGRVKQLRSRVTIYLSAEEKAVIEDAIRYPIGPWLRSLAIKEIEKIERIFTPAKFMAGHASLPDETMIVRGNGFAEYLTKSSTLGDARMLLAKLPLDRKIPRGALSFPAQRLRQKTLILNARPSPEIMPPNAIDGYFSSGSYDLHRAELEKCKIINVLAYGETP